MTNRIIKFRVWDGKEMFEPSSISWKDGVMWVCDKHGTNRFEYELVRPIEGLMQFTGLLDKNGKEIYEGDILEYFCSWKEEETKMTVDSPQEFFESKGYCERELGEDWSDCEIIGNIYENPDLLK